MGPTKDSRIKVADAGKDKAIKHNSTLLSNVILCTKFDFIGK